MRYCNTKYIMGQVIDDICTIRNIRMVHSVLITLSVSIVVPICNIMVYAICRKLRITTLIAGVIGSDVLG